MNIYFKKIACFLFFIFISSYAFSLNYSKCKSSGNIDVTSCLNDEISSSYSGLSLKKGGVYFITKPLMLHSNFVLDGNQSSIYVESRIVGGVVLKLSGSNITIKNLNISGNGFFRTSVESNCIGFTNNFTGIFIESNSKNIKILNNKINNFGYGISVLSSSHKFSEFIKVTGNSFNNLGHTAIYIVNAKNIVVTNNTITNIEGNLVCTPTWVTPSIQKSIFADAIYIAGVQNAIIASNYISNVKRIGIVLEGLFYNKLLESNVYNDNIQIINNKILNVNGSRGTEYNAGIWVEPYNNGSDTNYYKTENVIILNNTIDNHLAIKGSHAQWGIRLGAKNNKVISNHILNFNNLGGVGVVYSYGKNMLQTNIFESDTNSIVYGGDNPRNSRLLVE